MNKQKYFTLVFLIIFLSCKKNNFDINVRAFDGSSGEIMSYLVNNDSLKVMYSCDFENCKDSLVYSKKLGLRESKSLHEFLIKSKFDTLKNKYENIGYDGLNLRIEITGDNLKTSKTILKRFNLPKAEELMSKIDELIIDDKFKYTNWW